MADGALAFAAPRNPRLAQLAAQIHRLQSRGQAPPVHIPCGLAELDAALGGGFSAAAIHELIASEAGAAVRTVALRAAARAASSGRWIIVIDPDRDLYPPALPAQGVPLDRLIVVRAPRTGDAVWVTEQVLRCRAVAAVVVPMRAIDAYISRRLQLAAEAGGTLGLILRREARGGATFAASRIHCEPRAGPNGTRHLRITLLKLRDGRLREPFVVEVPDAADSVSVHAAFADATRAARRRLGS